MHIVIILDLTQTSYAASIQIPSSLPLPDFCHQTAGEDLPPLSWNQQVFSSVSATRMILQGDQWASMVSVGPLASVMKGKKLNVLQSCEVLPRLSPQADCGAHLPSIPPKAKRSWMAHHEIAHQQPKKRERLSEQNKPLCDFVYLNFLASAVFVYETRRNLTGSNLR